jgi:glycosyltransferase involved in cell wall biosynthesis
MSRFDKRKNLLEAVKYFCEHEGLFSNWRLIVAGYCSDKDKEYYKEILHAALGHRVEIKINLSGIDTKILYKNAKIFWHCMGLYVDENIDPLNVEHFGITTVEAMAAGAVPVVIDKGGQREIVDDGINGFRWKTLEELGVLTQRLIMDPNLRLTLSKAAVEKSNTYSIEAFNRNIDTIFREYNLIPTEYRR